MVSVACSTRSVSRTLTRCCRQAPPRTRPSPATSPPRSAAQFRSASVTAFIEYSILGQFLSQFPMGKPSAVFAQSNSNAGVRCLNNCHWSPTMLAFKAGARSCFSRAKPTDGKTCPYRSLHCRHPDWSAATSSTSHTSSRYIHTFVTLLGTMQVSL